ncbi:Hypothetical predicted protein [Pelobates cultripes]|uniref:Uncharacterized protein n=1 Tax=Pelobates cultripes TaxID=61616 RepID=A0AAD1SVT9_PELCU|nr:Hypothetical predicted protein [Pelobates cultripes]
MSIIRLSHSLTSTETMNAQIGAAEIYPQNLVSMDPQSHIPESNALIALDFLIIHMFVNRPELNSLHLIDAQSLLLGMFLILKVRHLSLTHCYGQTPLYFPQSAC